MKVYFALAVVFGVVAIAQAMSAEEGNAMKAKIHTGCKIKEGATDADAESLAAHAVPKTPGAKCMVACILETIGLIKDNKPDRAAAIAMVKMVHPGNDKAVASTNQIHDDCGQITDADRCELAAKLFKCTNDSLIKQGIDPKAMIV